MMSSIEVPNDNDKNFGGEDTKLQTTKGKEPTKVFYLRILMKFSLCYDLIKLSKKSSIVILPFISDALDSTKNLP